MTTLSETHLLREAAVVSRVGGLIDHDKLYEGISSRLPANSDRELLRELVETHRKGGKQLLEERIRELIDKVGSDT